jgi:hypothetical protein
MIPVFAFSEAVSQDHFNFIFSTHQGDPEQAATPTPPEPQVRGSVPLKMSQVEHRVYGTATGQLKPANQRTNFLYDFEWAYSLLYQLTAGALDVHEL